MNELEEKLKNYPNKIIESVEHWQKLLESNQTKISFTQAFIFSLLPKSWGGVLEKFIPEIGIKFDIYIEKFKLIVEIDGPYHFTHNQSELDLASRINTKLLQDLGYMVIRLKGEEIYEENKRLSTNLISSTINKIIEAVRNAFCLTIEYPDEDEVTEITKNLADLIDKKVKDLKLIEFKDNYVQNRPPLIINKEPGTILAQNHQRLAYLVKNGNRLILEGFGLYERNFLKIKLQEELAYNIKLSGRSL